MAATDRATAVGVFADRSHAEYAVEELCQAGFPPDQIGFLVPDAAAGVEMPSLEPGTKAEEGATLGAAGAMIFSSIWALSPGSTVSA